jgi:hypothetical protein
MKQLTLREYLICARGELTDVETSLAAGELAFAAYAQSRSMRVIVKDGLGHR